MLLTSLLLNYFRCICIFLRAQLSCQCKLKASHSADADSVRTHVDTHTAEGVGLVLAAFAAVFRAVEVSCEVVEAAVSPLVPQVEAADFARLGSCPLDACHGFVEDLDGDVGRDTVLHARSLVSARVRWTKCVECCEYGVVSALAIDER